MTESEVDKIFHDFSPILYSCQVQSGYIADGFCHRPPRYVRFKCINSGFAPLMISAEGMEHY